MTTERSSVKKPRKVFLHIGSDKAGSTALQLHLAANRDFLSDRGVHVPAIGGAAVNGHHGVFFQNMTPENIDKLLTDIDCTADDKSILLSWEGIHVLNEETLATFASLFVGCEFHIIYYIREQADLIQTGFLQQVKLRSKRANDIFCEPDYNPENRNYYTAIKKFEQCFPGARLDVVLYDRSSFPRKNIVYDFFDRIVDNIDYDDITIYDSEINSSLHLEEVLVLAQLENMCPDLLDDTGAAKRARLIDLLLAGDTFKGARNTSYFMSREQVDAIRRYYDESNQLLVNEYHVPEKFIDKKKDAWRDDDQPLSLDAIKSRYPESELNTILAMADVVYMDNSARDRFDIGLSDILQDGWTPCNDGKHWHSNGNSRILGSVKLASITPLYKYLRFFFRGGYPPGVAPVSSVFINSEHVGDFDLRGFAFQYPLEKLKFPYAITIDIVHKDAGASTPVNGEQTPFYRLNRFSCTFAQKKDIASPPKATTPLVNRA